MENNLQKICMWREIASRDDEKRRSGDDLTTLGKDTICYKCDGTRERALELECSKYIISEE